MSRFCEYCGSPLNDGVKFCQNCGHQVTSPSAQKPNTGPTAASEPTPANSPKPKPETTSAKSQPISPKNGKAKKKKGGCGRVLLWIVLIIVAIALVSRLFDKDEPEEKDRQATTQTEQPKTTQQPTGNTQGSPKTQTRLFTGNGFSATIPSGTKGGATLGGMKEAGLKLYVENGSLPEGASISALPASEELVATVRNTGKFDRIVGVMDIGSNQYDGAFFGSDVVLTMPMPRLVNENEKMEQNRYVFAYYDEATRDIHYLWPADYDEKKNTMSVRMPHFSTWWSAQLTEEEEIEAFLDGYCTKVAVENGRQKQAAAELAPYIEAKAKALGLTKEAAKDLVQATVNIVVSRAALSYGENTDYKTGEVTDYDFQENMYVSNGTKALTNTIRAVWENDPNKIDDGINDLVNSALMEAWGDLNFSKRAADALFKSEYVKEFVPGAINTPLSNAGGIAAVAGRMVEGDYKGAAEELGNVLQGIHPAAEWGTKGAKFLAAAANTAFTNWKSNEVEELYQVYKHGARGLFGNEVLPADRESFIEFLNYSSGFTKAKGVYRFYDMDKVAETCEKFGWSRSDYDNLDAHYKAIFEKRAEDGLMQYFELRRKQEAEAEKIKVQERICVKSMLDPHVGVLYSTNFAHFFGERSYKDFNVTKRLERLVHIRTFISQYVDEKELAKTAKIEGSFNYGSLLNEWVSFASRYPKDKAIEKFCEYLKNHNLLKAGSEPEPESNGVIPDEVVRLLEPYGGIDHVILNLKDGVGSITKCTFKQGEDYDGGVINVAYASTTSKDATCVIQVNANINNGTDDHCIFIPIKGKGTCKQKTFWLGH